MSEENRIQRLIEEIDQLVKVNKSLNESIIVSQQLINTLYRELGRQLNKDNVYVPLQLCVSNVELENKGKEYISLDEIDRRADKLFRNSYRG